MRPFDQWLLPPSVYTDIIHVINDTRPSPSVFAYWLQAIKNWTVGRPGSEATQPLHFPIRRHSVYNPLQFFQWLVMFQCSAQLYGSSVCQTIVSEATVHGVWSDTDTVELDPHWTNSMFLLPWQCLPLEETMILVWASIGKDIFQNSNWSIGSVVAIATDHRCTSNTESLCFCCYWQLLTTNSASMASVKLFLLYECAHCEERGKYSY